MTAGPCLDPPGPSASPTPLHVVVEDAVRDPWDWVLVAGAILSLLTAVAALWLAKRAADQAKLANHEAALARAAIATERRRTFELEILRDLLTAIDDPQLITRLAERPYRAMEHFGGRLLMLSESDLPFWRDLGSMTTADVVALAGVSPPESGDVPLTSRTDVEESLRSTLRADVEHAIGIRVHAVDDQVGAP